MLSFLFWNLGGERKAEAAVQRRKEKERKARILEMIGNLARLHEVDLLMLVESPFESRTIQQQVNKGNLNPHKTGFRENDPNSLCGKVQIFPRFPTRFLVPRSEGARYTGRVLRLPSPRMELNLFVVHFPSKRNASDESQSLAMPGFSAAVRRLENSGRTRHERTIVVGDLNQHPFDTGIVGAEGLNATMTRFVAEKVKRTVDGVKYPFFYNPMWSHYGDSTHENSPPGSPNYEPPGTCYYKASESRWHYWNIYDQVLLRPELLPFFRNSDLKILIGDGVTSLLDNNGIPDREAYSDHLPVFFRLDI